MAGADDIEEKIKKAVSEQLGQPFEKIQLNSRIVEDLGADSLDTVELVIKLEEAFETPIPDDDAERMKTVQDVVKYFQKRLHG